MKNAIFFAVALVLATDLGAATNPLLTCPEPETMEATYMVEVPVNTSGISVLGLCKEKTPLFAKIRFAAIQANDGSTFYRKFHVPPNCASNTVVTGMATIYGCADYAAKKQMNSFNYNAEKQNCTVYSGAMPSNMTSCEGRGTLLYIAEPALTKAVFATSSITKAKVHVHHDHIDISWKSTGSVCGRNPRFKLIYNGNTVYINSDVFGYSVVGVTVCEKDTYYITAVDESNYALGPTTLATCETGVSSFLHPDMSVYSRDAEGDQ